MRILFWNSVASSPISVVSFVEAVLSCSYLFVYFFISLGLEPRYKICSSVFILKNAILLSRDSFSLGSSSVFHRFGNFDRISKEII